MAMTPTTAQQRTAAFAPIPFAAISILSSSFVIYHLLFRERKKLKRLYHRLILAMNIALLPLSFAAIWAPFAVPEGTPYYAGAMGTVNTCTAQGFVKSMFTMTVNTYYASLTLQAFMGIRNNFKEENYRWIEIPIHVVAYCIPCASAIVIAATDNFNPSGVGCWCHKAPRGCESDPNVACQRGQDLGYFKEFLLLWTLFLYFVFPTSVLLALGCWMKKKRKVGPATTSCGMSTIREKARRDMMRRVYLQISVYLSSYWFTWALGFANTLYHTFTENFNYILHDVAQCISVSQGFVFMVVYFSLQKMGEGGSKGEYLSSNANLPSSRCAQELTVSDIRSNARSRAQNQTGEATDDLAKSFNFCVFDGEPDPDSPWAIFFDQGDDSDDEDALVEGGQPLPNEEIELIDNQRGSE